MQTYRLEEDKWLYRHVRNRIKKYWATEQICGTSKKDYAAIISTVTIYCWVFRNVACGGEFYKRGNV